MTMTMPKDGRIRQSGDPTTWPFGCRACERSFGTRQGRVNHERLLHRDVDFTEIRKADMRAHWRRRVRPEGKRAEYNARWRAKSKAEIAIRRQIRARRQTYVSSIDKVGARAAVSAAIRRGDLVKGECERPGFHNGRIEAHHFLGYAIEHYLDVEWTCALHHKAIHYPRNAEIRAAAVAGAVAA